MAFAGDYWKLKRAYAALQQNDLNGAFNDFRSCRRTAKISFNLAVIQLWTENTKCSIVHLKESLKADPYLAISAFYLGILENNHESFEECLKGFRDCTFINYTAIGLPFHLDREDVLFNLVSLQQPTANPTALNNLSIHSISHLLLNQFNEISGIQMRIPPFKDPQMIFNLLPEIEPEPFELKGPEHVSLIEGEEDYFSGFPDAHNRQLKLNLLSKNENYNESIEIESRSISLNVEIESKPKSRELFFIDQTNGDKLIIYSQKILNWVISNNKIIESE